MTSLETRTATAAWPEAAVDAVEQLLLEVAELRKENTQLREALESRVIIEQAKGVLAERFFLVPDQGFEAMRRAARSEGRKIHDVAADIVGSTRTPAAVAREVQERSPGGAR